MVWQVEQVKTETVAGLGFGMAGRASQIGGFFGGFGGGMGGDPQGYYNMGGFEEGRGV